VPSATTASEELDRVKKQEELSDDKPYDALFWHHLPVFPASRTHWEDALLVLKLSRQDDPPCPLHPSYLPPHHGYTTPLSLVTYFRRLASLTPEHYHFLYHRAAIPHKRDFVVRCVPAASLLLPPSKLRRTSPKPPPAALSSPDTTPGDRPEERLLKPHPLPFRNLVSDPALFR